MHGAGQESVNGNHKWAADACDGITWATKKNRKKRSRPRIYYN